MDRNNKTYYLPTCVPNNNVNGGCPIRNEKFANHGICSRSNFLQ